MKCGWLFNSFLSDFFKKNFYSFLSWFSIRQLNHRSQYFCWPFAKNLYCAGLLLNYLMSALPTESIMCVTLHTGSRHANFNLVAPRKSQHSTLKIEIIFFIKTKLTTFKHQARLWLIEYKNEGKLYFQFQ